MPYCVLKEDMNYVHLVGPFSGLKKEHSFLTGQLLDLKLDVPLVCEVDCKAHEQPCHFIDYIAPIFSGALLAQLKSAGIDNFQAYPVVLRNSEENLEWSDFFAINVVGLIDSADLNRSKFEELMPGDIGDGVPELLDFEEMVIDSSKIKGSLMFRDLRSPDVIVFDARIIDFLKSSRPAEGWRISIQMLAS